MNVFRGRSVRPLAIGLLAIAALTGPVWLASVADTARAQQDEKKADAPRRAARGRLPAHFAEVVTPEQREEVYAIQKKYAEEINMLRVKLRETLTKQSAEIDGVLSPEQLEKVSKLRAAAAARRAARQPSAGEDKPEAEEKK